MGRSDAPADGQGCPVVSLCSGGGRGKAGPRGSRRVGVDRRTSGGPWRDCRKSTQRVFAIKFLRQPGLHRNTLLTLRYAGERLVANPSWSAWPYPQTVRSSIEFHYLPLSGVMDGPNTFDFDAGLEPVLIDSASRAMHSVVRFYLEYPGNPTGVPLYLISGGLEMTPYNKTETIGAGVSPNYHDPTLIAAIISFASAFGARYDGDPRLAAIQIGLLGHWGEWHTWPGKFGYPPMTQPYQFLYHQC